MLIKDIRRAIKALRKELQINCTDPFADADWYLAVDCLKAAEQKLRKPKVLRGYDGESEAVLFQKNRQEAGNLFPEHGKTIERPAFNHTRGDSKLTPCPECAETLALINVPRQGSQGEDVVWVYEDLKRRLNYFGIRNPEPWIGKHPLAERDQPP